MLYIIRYGEIALKSGHTRAAFEAQLAKNIKTVLAKAGIKCQVHRTRGRLFLETNRSADGLLKRIFGIVSFSACESCEPEVKSIKRLAVKIAKGVIKPGQSFAVRTSRQKKTGPTSQRINEVVGSAIVTATHGKVRLDSPNHIIGIEIGDRAYVYTKKIAGLAGLPEGVGGKVIAIINRKQDLMAAWLAMRRGCRVSPVFKKKTYLDFFEKWSAFPTKYYRYKKIADIKAVVKEQKVYGIVVGNGSFRWERLGLPVFRPLLPYLWTGKRFRIPNNKSEQ